MEIDVLNKLSKEAREEIINKEGRLRELELERQEVNIMLDNLFFNRSLI